jgi:MSHA biogenesis protein MshQ
MKCNTAMISVRLFFLLIVLALLEMSQASAATYSLTPGSAPISTPSNAPALCSGNQGSWSGNTYRCDWNQHLSLQQGDVITSNAAVTIHSNSGMNLTNVTLGSGSNPITLTAESGSTIQLNNSVLYSSIGGGSTQNVVLTNNTIVHGSISVSGTIQSTNSTVMGTITSSNGAVTFTGGQALGHINVQCCKVTVSGGAVIHAGIRAGNNGIDISNSTVTGDLNAGDNEIILTNVTMLSGNISAGSNNVTINGGDITANVTNSNRVFINNGAVVHGDLQARYLVEASNSTIYGDIETTDNFPEGLHHVKLTDSTVYGNVTVRDDWGTIIGNWPSSAIYGDCDYKTVTESLCRPPPLHWKFDEAQWNNSPNQVLDSSTNQRHGSALNGAVTATNNPSPASCTYGDFQRGSSSSYPYVDIGRSAVFHNADNFSFSLWMKMNGADQSGSRQVILAYGDEEGVIDDDDGRFELYRRNSDNALVFALRMENDNLRYVEATGNVFNGQWHHVAFSYSKTERRMRLYIDNVLVDDNPNQNIGNSDDQKTPKKGDDEGLTIGALPDGSRGIKGQIDEVRFLNFELTAAEVATYAAETASCASAAPVLSWNLNVSAWTGAASEVLDTSGNSLNGRTYNSLLSSVSAPALTGDPGTCAFSQFNGSNQYIAVADNAKLDITDELTVAIWVRPRAYPGSDLMTILSKDTNYEFHLTPAGKIYWWWHDQDGVERTLTSNGSVPLNQWTHVAITYKNGAQRIYINGTQDTSTGSYTKKLATNNLALEVGRDNAANRYFNGDLDEVRIYARAHNQTKIEEIRQERNSCGLIATCLLTEEFTDYAQWYRTVRSGTVPDLVNGRLQLTTNDQNQSTSITFKQAFPTEGNKLTIEFDHFAYGGNGADGIGLVLSDATKTPVPGSFGGSLGYAPRNNVSPVQPGFAGGWLGVGFDEFGNYAKATEGRSGGVASNTDSAQAIGIRGAGSGTNGYQWLGWSGKLSRSLSISGSTPGRGDRFRITIDTATNASQVAFSLERRPAGTNTFTEVLNSSNVNLTNQPAMPANFLLSFTGSTGTNTNFHALDNVQVCSIKAPIPIAIGEESIHHFELSYGNSLTCSPTEVTVKACANSDCSQLYANQVSLQLTATNGAVFESSGSITFTGSQSINLVKTVVGATTIGIQPGSASVSTTNALQCKQNGVTSNCSLSFADSGFVFDVQDMIANQSQNVLIRAVRKDDSSQQCVPGFRNVTRPVKLWSDYIEPNAAARPESRSVLVNGIAIPKSYDSNTSQDLAFNANGQASVALNYTDAGQMQLNARYDGSAATGDNNLLMTGNDQFVSRPAGLCIREGNDSAAPVSCGLPYSNCVAYKKAGEDFNLSVIAKASENNGDTNICANAINTPNFKLNSIALSHSLIAPLVADGASPGALGVGSYNHIQSNGGIVTTAQTVSEVGVYTFTATPTANSYFGYTIAPATTAPVGRFTPAYFTATVNTPVLAACNADNPNPVLTRFAYLGQPVGYQIFPRATLTAKNVQNQITINYGLSFFKAQSMTAALGSEMLSATSYSTLSTVATPSATSRGKLEPASFDNYDGQFDLTMSDVSTPTASAEQLSFARTLPYSPPVSSSALGLKLDLVDTFVRDGDGVCVKTADNGSCLPVTFSNITAPELRYGRLILRGGSAPDTHPTNSVSIPVSLSAEYWDGTAFIINTADNCSAVNFNNMTVESGHGRDGVVGTLIAGENALDSLIVQVPADTQGSWPVFYDAPHWLKFDWLKEPVGQPLVLENPSSEVSVGRFRGNKRQIFWQERLN